MKEDLHFFPMNLVTIKHDIDNKTVNASLLGMGTKTAVYKEDLGCMLLKDVDDHHVEDLIETRQVELSDSLFKLPIITPEARRKDIQEIISGAFDESGTFEKKTRSVVVIHKDTLIAEHYAQGIDVNTPQLGWSMTKSLANAYVGILIKDSILHLDNKYKEDHWSDSVSLHQLLQMNSGIHWAEEYDEVSLATRTLYDSEMSAKPMMESHTEHPPGVHWEYSSGTTNYLSKIIREAINDSKQYQNFPYNRLSKRLQANSFLMEMDESGHFIMSSYGYATARDWSKFGLLYLHDGVWGNDRILPEGWVDFSVKPNGTACDGQYGAQIWLNSQKYVFPSIPKDAYIFNGFQGQHVVVIPSKDLVIVRLGLEKHPDMMDEMISSIVNTLQ